MTLAMFILDAHENYEKFRPKFSSAFPYQSFRLWFHTNQTVGSFTCSSKYYLHSKVTATQSGMLECFNSTKQQYRIGT